MQGPQVCVIANCQAWPMAQILATMSELPTRFISLNDVANPTSFGHASAKRLIEEAEKSTEVVYSFNAKSAFAPADTDGLRAIFGPRLKTFTNIRFDGLHPDMTYFGPFGHRWWGTMGEYHSKLIIYSFATGRSEEDCQALFNGAIYDRIGYFDIWNESASFLRSRDEACDIKFAEHFLGIARREHCLFSMNHPKSPVFHDLAKIILRDLGVTARSPGRDSFANPLFSNFIWPVYPEISEYFDLPYTMDMNFFLPPTGKDDMFFPRSMTLPDYIRAEYAKYRTYPQENLKAAAEQMPSWGRMAEVIG